MKRLILLATLLVALAGAVFAGPGLAAEVQPIACVERHLIVDASATAPLSENVNGRICSSPEHPRVDSYRRGGSEVEAV